MARRRPTRRPLFDNEFARPLGALVLLVLLALAWQIGLLAWVAEMPISILREGFVARS